MVLTQPTTQRMTGFCLLVHYFVHYFIHCLLEQILESDGHI